MKLLIVRVGAMGDVLHALPAVAALRLTQPDWQIDWAIDTRWSSLVHNHDGQGPIVNSVHLVPARDWTASPVSVATMRSIHDLRKKLRAERYDAVVDMQGTLRSAVIGRMAAAPSFAGYADPREPLSASFYKQKFGRRGIHVVDQGAALLGDATGLSLQPSPFDLPPEPWADEWATELVGSQKVCVLTPGGGWGAKRWPMENFAALARELRSLGFEVVVNAARKDDPLPNSLADTSQGAAKVVTCNVAGLTALLRRTALLIGGDSGPTHLAAALGIPLVALFGPTNPARNGPWGFGPIRVLRDSSSLTSYKKASEIDPGLAKISVQEVLAAVRELI